MIDKNISRRTRRSNSKHKKDAQSLFVNKEERVPKRTPYKRVKSFNRIHQVVEEE